jgi:hypothetical protein
MEGLVRLFPIHMDWMGLEKILKKFDLFGIQTHPIPLNPHGLRANRTSPKNSMAYEFITILRPRKRLHRKIYGSTRSSKVKKILVPSSP